MAEQISIFPGVDGPEKMWKLRFNILIITAQLKPVFFCFSALKTGSD